MEGSTALENLTTAFEWITTSMGTMAATILSQPIFLLGVGLFFAGGTIGLAKRLMS